MCRYGIGHGHAPRRETTPPIRDRNTRLCPTIPANRDTPVPPGVRAAA